MLDYLIGQVIGLSLNVDLFLGLGLVVWIDFILNLGPGIGLVV